MKIIFLECFSKTVSENEKHQSLAHLTPFSAQKSSPEFENTVRSHAKILALVKNRDKFEKSKPKTFLLRMSMKH